MKTPSSVKVTTSVVSDKRRDDMATTASMTMQSAVYAAMPIEGISDALPLDKAAELFLEREAVMIAAAAVLIGASFARMAKFGAVEGGEAGKEQLLEIVIANINTGITVGERYFDRVAAECGSLQ